ncbi:MAG: Hpt domain-containing protein [Gallionella sp.]|nr:Hpt domain-containing protein [Gallionella sp.]
MPSENNAALIRAQQLMQQLRLSYLAELPERVNELEQRTLALNQSDDFSGQFEALYRAIHSLKGGAGTYGVQIVSTISHQLEDVLAHFVSESGKLDGETLDRCIAYFDLMRLAIKETVQGKTSFPDVDSALIALRDTLRNHSLSALLVEPSRVNSTLYLGMLKNLPIHFSVVASGYEALGLLLQSHFDLLITGNETPVLNGVALITALRVNQGINQNIRAILVTSSKNLSIPSAAQPLTLIGRDEHAAKALLNEAQRYLENCDKAN